jgi:hypothetical protein
MNKSWKNNRKYIIPFFLSLISLFIGYWYRDCRESAKSTIVSGIKIEDLKDNLKTNSESLKQIRGDFDKADKKLEKIGDCLNREIIPTLNKISKNLIQPIQLSSLYERLEKYGEKVDTIQQQLASANEIFFTLNQSIIDAGYLIAEIYPEKSLKTYSGVVDDINWTTHTLEMSPAPEPLMLASPMIFNMDLNSTEVIIDKKPVGFKSLTSLKPEKSVEVKYFSWAGKLWAKSIEIKEEPQKKKK